MLAIAEFQSLFSEEQVAEKEIAEEGYAAAGDFASFGEQLGEAESGNGFEGMAEDAVERERKQAKLR